MPNLASVTGDHEVSRRFLDGSALVSLRRVSKRFSNGTVALRDMELEVEAGEFLSLFGPSGCGKSTALRIIAGLGEATGGQVAWSGRRSGRGDIGFVFQEATLMPWANVFDNVWLPLRLDGRSRSAVRDEVQGTLEMVGLGGCAKAYPRELSGGMKMRVSIARALVTRPKLLLMDEPFAALDEITRFKLNDDLLALWETHDWTIVFVTHSVFESVYLSNRIVVMAVVILGWEALVRIKEIPHYILPAPSRVLVTLVEDWETLSASLLTTLEITFSALAVAVAGGVGLAVLFTQSKWAEISFFPFAVVLQVTPIIAIAPLILIYVDSIPVALLICAWIVAFFPILSNTTLGLNSADHNLRNLFELYGASRWQTLRYLRLPAAMPYFLGGLRIAGGLALIGAIVAEFAAGSAGKGAGLAYRILESAYRLNIPRMFAALILISVTGILIFLSLSLLQHLLLRKWHESAVKREN